MEKSFTYNNQYYDEGIDGFHRASIPYIHGYFDALTRDTRPEAILDFGCGNGFHSAYLKSKTENVDGVDFSAAIRTSRNKDNYRTIRQADLGLPADLPENAYDLLFSIEVVEHVKDYRMFLQNAHHTLKPGGKLFLTTTTFSCYFFILLVIYRRKINLRNLYDFFRGWLGSETHRTRFTLNLWEFTTGHYHGFSKRQLRNGCLEAGFKVHKLVYLPIQDVVPVYYLKQRYNGRFGWLVNLFTPVLIFLGKAINRFSATTRIYTPNVLIIAEK